MFESTFSSSFSRVFGPVFSSQELPTVPTVPIVQSSIITVAQPDSITLQWDRPMMMTCNIKAQITVLADTAPVVVHDVLFPELDTSIMEIVVGSPFVAGQVVTWTYATGACMLQELALPQTEMDTQVYAVDNQIILLNRWRDGSGEIWEDGHGEEWLI